MSVILVGYRGSGKTTIGRLLAERLGWSFVDSDERIVARAGKSIREIFAADGEPAFRDLESSIVAELMSPQNHVVSLGGGAIMREANRATLKASRHTVVYLSADAQTLHDRIHADPSTQANRPSLTHLGGGIDEIRQLLIAREGGYRAVMTFELDVTHLIPSEAVDAIASRI